MLDNSIVEKIKNNISKKIVNGDKKAIVGYSGGSDSRFLVEILSAIVNDPKKNLVVCHINYGLRKLESDKDQQLVEKICSSLNLNLEIKKCSLSTERTGIQEKARRIRLEFFSDFSQLRFVKIISFIFLYDEAISFLRESSVTVIARRDVALLNIASNTFFSSSDACFGNFFTN